MRSIIYPISSGRCSFADQSRAEVTSSSLECVKTTSFFTPRPVPPAKYATLGGNRIRRIALQAASHLQSASQGRHAYIHIYTHMENVASPSRFWSHLAKTLSGFLASIHPLAVSISSFGETMEPSSLEPMATFAGQPFHFQSNRIHFCLRCPAPML